MNHREALGSILGGAAISQVEVAAEWPKTVSVTVGPGVQLEPEQRRRLIEYLREQYRAAGVGYEPLVFVSDDVIQFKAQ